MEVKIEPTLKSKEPKCGELWCRKDRKNEVVLITSEAGRYQDVCYAISITDLKGNPKIQEIGWDLYEPFHGRILIEV